MWLHGGWKERLLRTILCCVTFVDDSQLASCWSVLGVTATGVSHHRLLCMRSESRTTYYFNRGGPDSVWCQPISVPLATASPVARQHGRGSPHLCSEQVVIWDTCVIGLKIACLEVGEHCWWQSRAVMI